MKHLPIHAVIGCLLLFCGFMLRPPLLVAADGGSPAKSPPNFHGLDLAKAPRTSDPGKLPDLWEERPKDSRSYEMREGVKVAYSGFDGTVYDLPEKKRFYIQSDTPLSSTMTYFGPFEGNPARILKLETNKTAAWKVTEAKRLARDDLKMMRADGLGEAWCLAELMPYTSEKYYHAHMRKVIAAEEAGIAQKAIALAQAEVVRLADSKPPKGFERTWDETIAKYTKSLQITIAQKRARYQVER